MNKTSPESPLPRVNEMSKYAKCDLEPWYSFLIVYAEAGSSITASARQQKEMAGPSIY